MKKKISHQFIRRQNSMMLIPQQYFMPSTEKNKFKRGSDKTSFQVFKTPEMANSSPSKTDEDFNDFCKEMANSSPPKMVNLHLQKNLHGLFSQIHWVFLSSQIHGENVIKLIIGI